MHDLMWREPITDADFDALGECPYGMETQTTGEFCDCGRQRLTVTFLYRSDTPLDDRTFTICPLCSGHLKTMGRLFAMIPGILDNEKLIVAIEQHYGPRREWLAPYLN